MQVLERVLLVCSSDPDPDIRHATLLALTPPFDEQLAKADLLDLLIATIHDDSTKVREVAVHVLGRVSSHNPAAVVPALRGLLMDLLTELELSPSLRCKGDTNRIGRLLAA